MVGVDQSYQQAKELFELSASQGYATAQCFLGIMHNNGQGVEQSYEKAAEYYAAAAKQGYAAAQCALGALYALGHGVKQSFETARGWFIKSAEQGEELAIKGLQQLDEIEGRTTSSFTPKQNLLNVQPATDHMIQQNTNSDHAKDVTECITVEKNVKRNRCAIQYDDNTHRNTECKINLYDCSRKNACESFETEFSGIISNNLIDYMTYICIHDIHSCHVCMHTGIILY